MPRALSLIGLLALAAAAAGCSDSYRFQENPDANADAQDRMPLAVDNGAAAGNAQACGDGCQDDAQSSGGG